MVKEIIPSLRGRVTKDLAFFSLNKKLSIEDSFPLFMNDLSELMFIYKDSLIDQKEIIIDEAKRKLPKLKKLTSEKITDIRKVFEFGNSSLGITLPYLMAMKLDLKKNEKVELEMPPKEEIIILRKISS